MVTPLVKVRLFAPVIICSVEVLIVTRLFTERFAEESVKAESIRFKLVMDRSSFFKVELPPIVRVVGSVTLAVPKSKIPAPVRDKVVPDILNVPLAMVVAAGMVTVPPLLVICPKLITGELVKVRSFPPVMICSLTLLIVTALDTDKSDPRVKAKLSSLSDVTLINAEFVRVALAIRDKLVG